MSATTTTPAGPWTPYPYGPPAKKAESAAPAPAPKPAPESCWACWGACPS